jgi:hypothetical protein
MVPKAKSLQRIDVVYVMRDSGFLSLALGLGVYRFDGLPVAPLQARQHENGVPPLG